MNAQDVLRHAVAITLKKRPERTKAFVSRYWDAVNKIPDVILGFDGTRLPIPSGWETSEGAFGACLAHIVAWSRAMSDFQFNDNQPLTFFEDDVVFCDSFLKKLDAAASLVPDDWEIFYLGGERLAGRQSRTNVASKDGITVCREVNVNRLHAYCVRPSAFFKIYPRIIKYLSDAPSYNGPTGDETCYDYEIGRMIESGKLVAYGCSPWLCGQGAFGSDTYQRADAGSRVERYWNF